MLMEPDRREELARLKSAPRYQSMTTNLLGFPVKIVDAYSFLAMAREIFGEHIYRFKPTSSTPYIIDGGANIGLSVIYLKQLYPTAQVLAFEPDHEIYEVLNANVGHYSNVRTVKAALWSSNGSLQFMAEGSWAGRLCQPGDESTYCVPTVRLWEYLDRPIDLLKLDIEGAEAQVLFDCADRLWSVDHLFFEYHSFAGQRQELPRLLTLLEELGFRIFIEGYVRKHPFIAPELTPNSMDLQLNIFGIRERSQTMPELDREPERVPTEI